MTDDPRLAWDRVLDDLIADLDRVEHRLAADTPGPGPGAGSEPQGWTPPPPPPPPTGLADHDLAALRRRLAALQGRQNALVSRLMTAMTENRRHRALLDRAARTDDRPLYVDRRA
jgi:hypothetical protein